MSTFSKTALMNALGLVLYIAVVASVLFNGGRIFGDADGYLGSLAFLSLFTLSAAVVGGLILGKPLMLYLDNKKKEALSTFLQTIAWLAAFTVILMVALAAANK